MEAGRPEAVAADNAAGSSHSAQAIPASSTASLAAQPAPTEQQQQASRCHRRREGFQERYRRLKAYIQQLDSGSADSPLAQGSPLKQRSAYSELVSAPISLLNQQAVELEKRALRLGFEEGREMKRVRLLDVLKIASRRSTQPVEKNPASQPVLTNS
eukprot:jgi/Chlat1/3483/Chrsp23S03684